VRRAAAILAVSEQTKRDLVRLLGVAPEKVRVTYLAADPVFRPAEEDEGREFAARWGLERPYLLYVGHRGEHKNFRVLAQAFRDQRLAEFMLLLVGGQPEAPELAQFDEATAGRVVHVKSAEDVELRLAYAGAAVFVFPSLYEGFGLPVLEAMSCGAPVAASDIPTTREVYGDACELFAPTDPDGLVQAVLRACQPSRRNELLAAGLARAAQFSWERCASETLETYRSVLGLA
jgi:glycosyltransferase involved in cell wall biosynthesis